MQEDENSAISKDSSVRVKHAFISKMISDKIVAGVKSPFFYITA
jgi:hypothetical protein